MSKKFDYWLINHRISKSRILTILFGIVFVLIYVDSFSKPFTSHVDFADEFQTRQITENNAQPKPFSATELPVVMGERIHEVETEAADPLIPPSNVTRLERLEWFRRKLPELEILNSNDLSQKFHARVTEFLKNACTVQFYMIWLSPVSGFGRREFLAMDSLFKANPHACLIIVSKSMDSSRGYRILKPLLDLGFKVLAVTPDLPILVKNTPAEAWLNELKSGRKDPGYIPLSVNLSNMIRVALLIKYGGVYLDTDFIVLKDFKGLRNVLGAQVVDEVTGKWTQLNGAMLIFDANHPLLIDFQQEFATTFNGNNWGHNGPKLISRVIQRIGTRPGYDFEVLPPKAFYPVDWIKIRKLFKKPANGAELRWVENMLLELNDSYALHLWNKRSRELVIEDDSVMDRLISKHCVVCQQQT
ncbi:hypothetical protein Tsubulata_033710 [Turnera subulata]|uniref:Alpha 1,4-glycosyltransferase domain-containing protein n=1 Tax=Turnera subulata TaxID=218843 RepID=A0A9Q0J6D9_9ROSI|nr:hypothetical protein Tsubulata_033710 [Turnera subulata]